MVRIGNRVAGCCGKWVEEPQKKVVVECVVLKTWVGGCFFFPCTLNEVSIAKSDTRVVASGVVGA